MKKDELAGKVEELKDRAKQAVGRWARGALRRARAGRPQRRR